MIDFKSIEKKWQKKWEEEEAFLTLDNPKKSHSGSSQLQNAGRKFYVLEMFPYPSGSGLHMGHALNYTIGDIFARFKRMNGFNVLYPMGYDALGLPAENAAIKERIHPEKYTNDSIINFIRQQKLLGLSYDWTRMINTASPNYYKWDQWIFLKMLEKGLVYQKEASVNWCPSCKTVLANEQAQNGICERCKTKVEMKTLKQWFFKITKYADELYEKIDSLDWPQRTKTMQKNWIGKSYGTEIDFEIETSKDKISNVVIVHGCPNGTESRSDEERAKEKHWRLWVKDNLEKIHLRTDIPLMPEPWKQDYKRWKKKFEELDINENSILVGLSCGTAFLVRWLGETKRKIKKLILVAPWKIPHREDGSDKEFYEYKIDNCLKENIKEIVIFTSDNEEDDGKKSVKIFNESLGGKIIELRNHGHYDFKNMRTYEFPELLEEILKNNSKQKFPIFTTRPDTLFGVTFMVISAQHQRLDDLVSDKQREEVDKFLKKLKGVSEKNQDELDKQGVFTGSYAINPINGKSIPIYAGNFVLADYGSGMVMAVPAHDQRDFKFAKKYGLSSYLAIENPEDPEGEKDAPYTGKGRLINSGEFNGLENEKAKEEITKFLINKKLGRKKIQFKLRDWLISRQRYWGTPIPIIHCEKCGAVPVPEKDLPIMLPKKVTFGEGNPLETNEEWIRVKCPKCGGEARRETDTMDTFVNSSWYFLRYCDPDNVNKIFDKEKVKYWMPVDQYIGGAEHACMHLIYARFYTKFLRDLGLINFDEPFTKLFHQGMLHGEDGEKMSKSRGNTIDPVITIDKFGTDSLRLALMSFASPDSDTNWDEKVLAGSHKFLKKVYDYFEEVKIGEADSKTESKVNKIIKDVTNKIENFKYNLAIIKVRELFNSLPLETSKEVLGKSLKLLSVFCPHIAEELWEKIGNSDFISLSSWPKAEDKKINDFFDKQDEALEKLVGDIVNILKIVELKEESKDTPSGVPRDVSKETSTRGKVYVYVIPGEEDFYDLEELNKRVGKEVKIFSVKDKDKYDPNNISKKAKPGKPGIYLE